jgi:hypothetical protein
LWDTGRIVSGRSTKEVGSNEDIFESILSPGNRRAFRADDGYRMRPKRRYVGLPSVRAEREPCRCFGLPEAAAQRAEAAAQKAEAVFSKTVRK